MTPLYIFDLDGTLADATHRQHYVHGVPKEQQDWRAFFAACADDAPITRVIQVLRALANTGAEIFIWTGRSDEVRGETTRWLSHNCISYDQLLMRAKGDHRTDVALKRLWYEEMLSIDQKKRLVTVFEDRDSVVAMWRSLGVLCLQVAPGAF